MKRLITPIGLLVLCSGAWAQPTNEGALFLQKALSGPVKPYTASARITLYRDNGPPTTADVRIYADGKGDVLRQYSGPAQQRIRLLKKGTAWWQQQPNGEWIRLPDAADADPALAARLILGAYRVHVQPAPPVAGLDTVRIELEPLHAWDPSRRLWMNPSTGIILRDEFLAPGGKLRSSTEVLHVELKPQEPALFRAPVRALPNSLFGPASFSPRPSQADVEKETQRPILLPAYVPPGYRIVLFGVMRTGSGRLMPVVRYSNGISAFSVFQRGRGPRMHPGAPQKPRCVGSTSLQQAVVTVTGRRANYILLGDLAEAILQRVGRSLP
ncbi:MAG: hypothetical protein ACP5VE_04340 [Chthonomonadales bacterium]